MVGPLQSELFETAPDLPDGLRYQAEFISAAEERSLIALVESLPLAEAKYKEWDAKRRIVSYGGRYDFTNNELLAAPAIPDFLHPLRLRAAAWSGVPVTELNHAMVAEYRAGTQLGWHRDVPQFETIIGVSLAGAARMRLRPYPPKPGLRSTRALEIAPRSIYSMRDVARWDWQHAISPTKALRYSITFRTRVAS